MEEKKPYLVLGNPDVGLILDDGEPHYGGETVHLTDREAKDRVARGRLQPLAPPETEGGQEEGQSEEKQETTQPKGKKKAGGRKKS